jgi:hypothetical protein
MSDSVQDCIDRLRDLAQSSTSDYRIAAGQIVSDFNAQASGADREKLKRRLEDALLVGRNSIVSYVFYPQHLAWLAVLEGALDAARKNPARRRRR